MSGARHRKAQAARRPAYIERLQAMMRAGDIRRGIVADVTVEHDDNCSFWKQPGTCDCNPNIIVREIERKP